MDKDLQKFSKALELFNGHYFWECHEALEELWLEEPRPLRYLYWTILQTATSLYHYEAKKLSGAYGQITKAKQKLDEVEANNIEQSEFFQRSLDKSEWNNFKALITNRDFNGLLKISLHFLDK